MSVQTAFLKSLEKIFYAVEIGEPLAAHTTLGVGGGARYFVVAQTTEQIMQAARLCTAFDMPMLVLGCGSNLIISDRGFPGLVLQNRATGWHMLGEAPRKQLDKKTSARFETVGHDYYSTAGLSYSDRHAALVRVRVDSGARFAPLLKALFREGITGLQWFAGIPATVGGATYMNMHGGQHFFGDFIESASLFSDGEIKQVDHKYFQFDYDWSILHKTREIVLCVDLLLRKGDVESAKKLAREWARRKAIQPQKSAGCIFQNLAPGDQKRLNLPTPSIGYVFDKVLDLKGKKIGGAIVSPRHAAFIENTGNATATDVFRLVQLIRETAKKQLDVELEPEVEFIGEFRANSD